MSNPRYQGNPMRGILELTNDKASYGDYLLDCPDIEGYVFVSDGNGSWLLWSNERYYEFCKQQTWYVEDFLDA